MHKWPISEDESFNETQRRYMYNLFAYLPNGTESVHIVCARYDQSPSLKFHEGKTVYDVLGHLPTPIFRDFICSKDNKLSLLRYLYESWNTRCNSDLQLTLGGGFSDIMKSMCVHNGEVVSVHGLQST